MKFQVFAIGAFSLVFLLNSMALAEESSPPGSLHPRGAIKREDVLRARKNLEQHDWAKEYHKKLMAEADFWLSKLTPAFLEEMLPETTPWSNLGPPCPACRDLGKPKLPHGKWNWKPEDPNRISCDVCGTVFPSDKHPETVVVQTKWGRPQTFTFDGGPTIKHFRYPAYRSSVSGHIRGRKVDWSIRLARKFAELYTLTSKPEYAKATRSLLLRLADVYPFWLVHSMYGEIADMDPKEAAKNLNQLPQDEAVYPPNQPDRDLFAGYWAAGRASAIGLEGIWVELFATAYDLTRGATGDDNSPVYSDAERTLIENNLLKESTVLLVADKEINNKSINNRAAAGIVGAILEDPELVRFGLEGFNKLVNNWFLPDGTTPESSAYGVMALDGCATFIQALRGYSDPTGYRDAKGHRYDNFDPYRDTNYPKIWDGMFNTLQGDLFYPPIADSYNRRTTLGAKYAELMADNYSDRKDYLALLKAYAGGDWSQLWEPFAIYYGNPDRQNEQIPPLTFKSVCPPDLRVGFMRSGKDGRESLLLLSASHWGEHHHEDSLNLYYWKNGEELLSDLGYLWDHPDGRMTLRTFAHNVVLVDKTDQATHMRGGSVHFFLNRPNVRAMSASSTAYPNAALYERTSALVDHGDGNNYAVDVFWAKGGRTLDFLFHGPNQRWRTEAATAPVGSGFYDLKNVKKILPGEQPSWRLTWNINPKLDFSAWNLVSPEEKSYVGDGWGQRDSNNSDRGQTIPYIIRRAKGTESHAFASVFEGYLPGNAFVRQFQSLPVGGAVPEVIALQIDTADSRDYVIVSPSPQTVVVQTPDGVLECKDARFCVVSVKGGAMAFSETDSGQVTLKPPGAGQANHKTPTGEASPRDAS